MSAEVYEWEMNKVIKLYYEGYPSEWIQYEAEVGRAVREAGVPAPAVYDMIADGNRTGVIYERIDGSSMFNILQTSPLKIIKCAREMARLHYSIHQCSTSKLPRLIDKLEQTIRNSSEVLLEKTEVICKILYKFREGTEICHGDFHPDNILMSGSGTKAIDWNNACVGNPLYDVARTCLMFRTPFIPPDTPKSMTLLIPLAKKLLHWIYVKEYLSLSGVKLSEIEEWMLPAAAARLSDRIPGEQKWLLDLIDKGLNTRSKKIL